MLSGYRFDLPIENLRNYPAEVLAELRQLLTNGSAAVPDPRRKDFYELEGETRGFYIHVSPITGRVLLLGSWLKREAPTGATFIHQAA